jgi:hypothetical protein
MIGDKMFSIAKHVVIKIFPLPIVWWQKKFFTTSFYVIEMHVILITHKLAFSNSKDPLT